TPRVGLFSADTWAAVAIVVRNILINWLILLPVLALVVIGVKVAVLVTTTHAEAHLTPGVAATCCLLFGALAFGYKLARLYSGADLRRPAGDRAAEKRAQGSFIRWSLTPAMLGGACFVYLALQKETPAAGLAETKWAPWLLGGIGAYLPDFLKSRPPYLPARAADAIVDAASACWPLVLMLFFAGAVYLLAVAGATLWAYFHIRRQAQGASSLFAFKSWDAIAWLGGAAAFATMVWLGVTIFAWVGEGFTPVHDICLTVTNACVSKPRSESITINRYAVAVIFGIPWFLLATILAHSGYLLLRSMSFRGDVEREWLGRASGWHFIAALGWMMLSAVVLFGPSIYANIPLTIHVLTIVSGTVTAWLGKSGLTSATGGAAGDLKGLGAKIALAIAGPIFAVLLLMLLSVWIDWAVQGSTSAYACFPTSIEDGRYWAGMDVRPYWDCSSDPERWAWLTIIVVLVLGVANCLANVNAFSLHAIYRNRLIRCFLGAARATDRKPDGFTDFDWNDDLRVAQLWEKNQRPDEAENWRPLHVINMTLNLTEPNKLAWQQRKAMPFSVSPFHCGNASLGYRATDRYGGRGRVTSSGETMSGITLGTALAISGAAVSSNMGYHSSMSLSFLLTFFNVRLGVWLGNPGWRRPPWQHFLPDRLQHWTRPYRYAGPRFAAHPLVSELFGLINADSPYVYLSDGGHFEDLAIYEMVRRRCKYVVVVDAGQDADRGYVDLGNAVRKIWIDLGVRITFEGSPLLKAAKDAKPDTVPYFAVGTIEYLSDTPVAVPQKNGPPKMETPTGKILYLKPVVRGDEAAADVIAYKRANDPFPDQTTGDQWFDESQFEAYRRLGHLMVQRIVKAASTREKATDFSKLFEGLKDVDPSQMSALPAAPPQPDT
ncbi:MAG TPA: hypothetical protein VFQ90_14100, partial [Stellaceae bacterium]|nr:hypothetical protein [Stellaceae bacterium]